MEIETATIEQAHQAEVATLRGEVGAVRLQLSEQGQAEHYRQQMVEVRQLVSCCSSTSIRRPRYFASCTACSGCLVPSVTAQQSAALCVISYCGQMSLVVIYSKPAAWISHTAGLGLHHRWWSASSEEAESTFWGATSGESTTMWCMLALSDAMPC